MAQCFRRLGSEAVTLIEGGPRLLPREEPFASEEVRAAFVAEGIDVIAGAKMTAVRREARGGPVTATIEDGRTFTGNEILVAVGRRARTKDVGLEYVGLEPGKFLAVDERLRVKGVDGSWLYAVGDCTGLALLTHMGKYQGRLAGDAILGRDVVDIADYDRVPRVTFTDPQVAAVGMTEAQAREKSIDVRAVSYPTGAVAGAITLGNGIKGTSQLVVDQSRHVIVGATFTGPGVQELVHAATIAVVAEVPLERLWHAVPAFPTVSEVWLRLLEGYGM
jgi:dihydrolipoamide dehydrogenase